MTLHRLHVWLQFLLWELTFHVLQFNGFFHLSARNIFTRTSSATFVDGVCFAALFIVQDTQRCQLKSLSGGRIFRLFSAVSPYEDRIPLRIILIWNKNTEPPTKQVGRARYSYIRRC